MANNGFARIVNWDTVEEWVRFDLGQEFSLETAIVLGELSRQGDAWKFGAIGRGYAGGLSALADNYGVRRKLF